MNGIRSCKNTDQVVGIDEAMVELFMPTRERNLQTTQFCHELEVDVAITILTEMEDEPKATHLNLLTANGTYSKAVVSADEECTSFGMHANNDPSEGTLLHSIIFCAMVDISILQVLKGIGQA
jgi:hypothetical protein